MEGDAPGSAALAAAPTSSKQLPGLQHTTQANINKLFGLPADHHKVKRALRFPAEGEVPQHLEMEFPEEGALGMADIAEHGTTEPGASVEEAPKDFNM